VGPNDLCKKEKGCVDMKSQMDSKTKITAIIPILNSGRTIERCIDSLLRMDNDMEILAVYDEETIDRTYSILKKYKNKITILKTNGASLAQSRNYGAKKATYDILFFVDSDTVYEPDYVTSLEKQINSKEIGAVMGAGYIYNPKGFYQKSKDVDRRIRMRKGYKIFGLSTGWITKRDIYMKIGGYTEELEYGFPEDVEIVSKLHKHGYKTHFENQTTYYEIERASIIEDLQRFYRRGQGYAASKTTKEQKRRYLIPYLVSSLYISLIPISVLGSLISPLALLYIVPYIVNILKKYKISSIQKSEIIYLIYFKSFSIIISLVQLTGFITKIIERKNQDMSEECPNNGDYVPDIFS
jgi:cellulose synthase/poly-beta-1,6-N-acetylglucosamine synthase-like glycosyltransferase